jgi:hypothetical protein
MVGGTLGGLAWAGLSVYDLIGLYGKPAFKPKKNSTPKTPNTAKSSSALVEVNQ